MKRKPWWHLQDKWQHLLFFELLIAAYVLFSGRTWQEIALYLMGVIAGIYWRRSFHILDTRAKRKNEDEQYDTKRLERKDEQKDLYGIVLEEYGRRHERH